MASPITLSRGLWVGSYSQDASTGCPRMSTCQLVYTSPGKAAHATTEAPALRTAKVPVGEVSAESPEEGTRV